MRVGGWLESRTPRAPAALAARIRQALGDHWSDEASRTHAVCEAAAEGLLASLLAAQQTGRETALDLLAADALVTYAFEHAAESAADLEAGAGAVMERVAAIGARFATGSGAR
ncbi:MAG: hypothetical protein ACRENQ_07255 [Gemmatimonadaceae bacterium]